MLTVVWYLHPLSCFVPYVMEADARFCYSNVTKLYQESFTYSVNATPYESRTLVQEIQKACYGSYLLWGRSVERQVLWLGKWYSEWRYPCFWSGFPEELRRKAVWNQPRHLPHFYLPFHHP